MYAYIYLYISIYIYIHLYISGMLSIYRWPVLGVELALLGKLLVHAGQERQAVPVLREAVGVLELTCGGGRGAGEDAVVAEAARLLRECEWSLSGMGQLA